jgi:hypothetical protein
MLLPQALRAVSGDDLEQSSRLEYRHGRYQFKTSVLTAGRPTKGTVATSWFRTESGLGVNPEAVAEFLRRKRMVGPLSHSATLHRDEGVASQNHPARQRGTGTTIVGLTVPVEHAHAEVNGEFAGQLSRGEFLKILTVAGVFYGTNEQLVALKERMRAA